MAKSPVFFNVKSEDIASAMKASETSTKAAEKVKGADGIVWAQTVTILMERVDLAGIKQDTTEDGIKVIRDHLIGIMSNHICASVTLPEKGKNRQGKEFNISNPDGTVKWSSWDQTRRIWSYIGDVAKVLAYGKASDLYPEQYKIAARCDVLSLCKVPEGISARIQRLTSDLQDTLLPLTDKAEVLDARLKVGALHIPAVHYVDKAQDLINNLDAVLSKCSQEDKDAVATMLQKLSTHFA